MTMNLKKELLKAISFVPGLVGFSDLDFSKKPIILKEENWDNGITIEKTNEGSTIKVSTIISIDLRAKLISKEISEAVKNIFKNNNEKVYKVIVYIRGVE